jgi:hypothetical protein
MTSATQHILRIAAVLALTAASTSAMAQERRYDEGYNDGPRLAMQDRDYRDDHRDERRGPPGWARVRVEEARYGARGSVCNARQAVRDSVERNRGEIRVGNDLCGDPARGAQKRLSVVYRCGNSESVRIAAREGEILRLSCRR